MYVGNIYLGKAFGKTFMVIADLLVAYLIDAILKTLRKRSAIPLLSSLVYLPSFHSSLSLFHFCVIEYLAPKSEGAVFDWDMLYVCLWLFNPFVVNVSTRYHSISFLSSSFSISLQMFYSHFLM